MPKRDSYTGTQAIERVMELEAVIGRVKALPAEWGTRMDGDDCAKELTEALGEEAGG